MIWPAQILLYFENYIHKIWYPTNVKGETIHYLGEEKIIQGFSKMESEIWMNRFNRIRTNTVKEVEIAPSKKKYPVVFFSAGFGLSKNYNTMFLEALASQGFIVVSIDLPYVNPLVTEMGESINSAGSFWDSFPMTKGIDNYIKGKEKLDFTYEYFEQDYEFIYQQLRVLNKESFFHNSLDLENLASIGHSAGSIPTFGLMRKSKTPFKAFIVYDVNLHANYVSETMFFSKVIKTNAPIGLFIFEYASIPPQEFVDFIKW